MRHAVVGVGLLLVAAVGSLTAFAQIPVSPPPRYHQPNDQELDRAGTLLSSAIDAYRSNPTKAAELLRQSMRILDESWGAEHPETGRRAGVVSFVLAREGWFEAAELMGRRAIEVSEKVFGPTHKQTNRPISLLAHVLADQYEPELAELLYSHALSLSEQDNPGSLESASNTLELAKAQAARAQYDLANRNIVRSLLMRESLEGPQSSLVAVALQTQGAMFNEQRRWVEAEAVLRRAAAMDPADWPTHLASEIQRSLGESLLGQGRLADARIPLTQAVSLFRENVPVKGAKYFGPAVQALAVVERKLGHHEHAVDLFREGCALTSMGGLSRDEQRSLVRCMQEGVLSLWERSRDAPADEHDTLKSEAFVAIQFAELFESGYALSRYGARIEATARRAAADAWAYDETLRRYDNLRLQYARSFAGLEGWKKRPDLRRKIDAAWERSLKLQDNIVLKSPLYWELQAPAALPVEAIQSARGNNSKLLDPDEALIAVLIPPGSDRGVVFALTKSRFEWAETTLTGDEIASMVLTLRSAIDPRGYDTRADYVAGARFSRQTAYELYLGLFGDRRIAEVIASAPNLLIVPSGPLASLPPGVLVTAPPPGGAEMDGDTEALRNTAWLLKSKSITILPSVSTLRTLRQVLPENARPAAAKDRLIAFADPDFQGRKGSAIPIASPNGREVQEERSGASTTGMIEQSLVDLRATLRPLEGARNEAKAVKNLLGAPLGSVNLGSAASETRLRKLGQTGQLERAEVIQFATHGIVGGGMTSKLKPMLVLAAPENDADPALDDGFLTADEVALLRLNANWVILSACNSAAPDSPNGQGLSGLARGFFLAGARSLLISHWTVHDDVAPILVPDTLARLKDGRAKTKAQALQQAALAILNDETHSSFANPRYWAPFVLVGDGRE